MKIAIAGCNGRMGQALIKAALVAKGVELVAGSVRPGTDAKKLKSLLTTLGAGDLSVTSDSAALAKKADAVIDFTSPDATLDLAANVARSGGIHIIGTTGLSQKEITKLKALSKRSRIVQSGNFSLGINLLEMLVEKTAGLLDDTYDIEIFEMHHKHKKDAPSGTALMLGRAAAQGRDVSLESKKISGRNDITGERKKGDIGFSVARGGDVVGVHTVTFAGPGEVIELKHQGFSRDIYANGAIKAALWAKNKEPGLYSMKDVLGL